MPAHQTTPTVSDIVAVRFLRLVKIEFNPKPGIHQSAQLEFRIK